MTVNSTTTDESIVATVIHGDVDAYALLMDRYEAKLRRYVVYLIHDDGAAADIVQETFIKAYHNLRGFNAKYKFSSWIYRIAHNEAMNAIRKNRHVASTDIDQLADESYESNAGDLLDSQATKKGVHDCLSKIAPKYREVVQLIYFEHMKYEEVSDVLHIPTSTVGVRLSRAKKKLKDICQKKGVTRS